MTRRIKRIIFIIKSIVIFLIKLIKNEDNYIWFIFLFMLVESFSLTNQFKVEGISFKLFQ